MPLDDEHWDMEEIPDRTLCVHEHALPHETMPIPMSICRTTKPHHTTATLDLSDTSEFKDIMTTSSEEDITLLEDIVY